MGINKSPSAVYPLDVTGSLSSNASINMSTWPRVDTPSNMMIVRQHLGTRVGNTFNWTDVQQNTISPNLATVVLSSPTDGCSFKVLKSGIWFIVVMANLTFGGTPVIWVDASTGNHSNIAPGTNGNPYVAFERSATGASTQINWIGYLPSNDSYFYKIRANTTVISDNSSYWQLGFLHETSNAGGNYPFP
jgi:hypothetical protein